jgi:hypothetical protein
MKALDTCRPVRGVVMGVYHPEKKEHRWIRVDAIPEFNEGEARPFQVFAMFEDVTNQIDDRHEKKEESGEGHDAVQ